jgi:short-subunit dehydrogenase
MENRQSFKERYGTTALVTGASSGIGRAFAQQLAEEGLRLILVARRRALLDELARELRLEYGTRCLVIAEDLTSPGAVQELCAQIEWEGWGVDLLVNNAGVGRYGHFEGSDPQADQNTLILNCSVPLELMQRLLPAMRERRHGGVICVGSLLADLHAPYFATYSASKAFIATLAQSLQAELSGSGVDLLLLVPGLTRTEFFASNGISREFPFPASTPDRVAQLALRALGRRSRITQGWMNRIFRLSYSLMPGGMSAALNRILMAPRPDENIDPTEGQS